MATDSDAVQPQGLTGSDWIAGVLAGLVGAIVVGAIIQFGIDATILEEGIPDVVDQSGLGIGWAILLVIGVIVGVVYAALNAVDTIGTLMAHPTYSAVLGLIYGLVLWGIALVVVPLIMGDGTDGIGDYAVTMDGVLTFALLGVVVGFVYLLVPAMRTRV